jgi:hypothetical protein
MKRTALSLLGLALLAIGCVEGTPGGPGVNKPPATPTTPSSTTTTANKPTFGPEENTFSLDVPNLSTHVKQGETRSVSVSMSRGKNFDDDVSLKFENVPAGVMITPATALIKHGDTEAKVNVQAAGDAALGNFTVKVIGHPSTGADATVDMKLTIDEK